VVASDRSWHSHCAGIGFAPYDRHAQLVHTSVRLEDTRYATRELAIPHALRQRRTVLPNYLGGAACLLERPMIHTRFMLHTLALTTWGISLCTHAGNLLSAPSSMTSGTVIQPATVTQPMTMPQPDMPPAVQMPAHAPAVKRITPAVSVHGDEPKSPQLTQAPSERMTGESKLPLNMRPYDQQLKLLWRQVEDLQRRLAFAEKNLAEHRHIYSAPHVNQLNYRTVRSLLNNADQRDGLLNFPGMPVSRETGLPVVPQ
jgi:hypothetical protein